MATQKYEWILDRIAQVEREDAKSSESASVRDDADDLVEELLIHASRSIDFPKLSDRLQERRALDLSTLRAARILPQQTGANRRGRKKKRRGGSRRAASKK
jgi:hypothetical protein